MNRRTAILLTALGVSLLYGFTARHHEFVYDDSPNIIEQAPIRSLSEAAHLFIEPSPAAMPYYRPLTRLTLQGQTGISGLNPAPLIVGNALLAGCYLLAIYRILRRAPLNTPFILALLAATACTLHPIASSSVYPIASGRETLLPAICFLMSMSAYLGRGTASYVTAVLWFALALCGKETAIVLPLLFATADALRLTTWARSPRAICLRFLPMACLLVLYFGVRHVLYRGAELALAIPDNPLGPLQAYLYAVQTIVAPTLALKFEPPLATWWSWPSLIAALAAVIALAIASWRARARTGRSTAFWGVWFLLTQCLTANILVQDAPFAERYVLLALIAPVAILAQAGAALSVPRRRLALVAGTAAVFVLTAISMQRARFYRNEGAFCAQWVRTNPDSAIGNMGYARWLAGQGQAHASIPYYDRAIALRPGFADAYNNRGCAYRDQGRHREAFADFQKALELRPDSVLFLNNRAASAAALQDTETALRDYAAAIQLGGPDSLASFMARAALFEQMRALESARDDYTAALQLWPDHVPALFNRGNANMRLGDPAAAIADLTRAITLTPNDPALYNNRAACWIALGNRDAARADLAACARLGREPHPGLVAALESAPPPPPATLPPP